MLLLQDKYDEFLKTIINHNFCLFFKKVTIQLKQTNETTWQRDRKQILRFSQRIYIYEVITIYNSQ